MIHFKRNWLIYSWLIICCFIVGYLKHINSLNLIEVVLLTYLTLFIALGNVYTYIMYRAKNDIH